MKEWIGYYENALSDEISNGIMNIKDGWETSTYSNHNGKIGIEKSKERVVMDENYIKTDNVFWTSLCNASKAVTDAYKKRHPYMYYYNPISMTNFRVNRYGKGGSVGLSTESLENPIAYESLTEDTVQGWISEIKSDIETKAEANINGGDDTPVEVMPWD